jgi:hypothetical protein
MVLWLSKFEANCCRSDFDQKHDNREDLRTGVIENKLTRISSRQDLDHEVFGRM